MYVYVHVYMTEYIFSFAVVSYELIPNDTFLYFQSSMNLQLRIYEYIIYLFDSQLVKFSVLQFCFTNANNCKRTYTHCMFESDVDVQNSQIVNMNISSILC